MTADADGVGTTTNNGPFVIDDDGGPPGGDDESPLSIAAAAENGNGSSLLVTSGSNGDGDDTEKLVDGSRPEGPGYESVEVSSHPSSSTDQPDEDDGFHRWVPSPNSKWSDFCHFVGPGWFVCIAYVDPGNYQADIQAGATTRYYLLFALWWTSVLSIYVQILCVRLAIYGQVTLAEVQARDINSRGMRYVNWFIAEFSAVITDLPEVIGIGIACNVFFGWPYYVGVALSLVTTMLFLALLRYGLRLLEKTIVIFVGIMSVALFVEMGFVGVDGAELWRGWTVGFLQVTSDDIFAITGILGSVVMPHNLYLHTAACQSRRVLRREAVVRQAVKWCSVEPVVPILVSFFVNLAIVSIAAERIYGQPGAAGVGLTDFCNYFQRLKGGCVLWGVALLAAGQSSAITTTFTGQYVMDGFLNIQLPVAARAVLTRLVAIAPCVAVSVMFPDRLNEMVNVVNAALSFFLPFAFTPLVKYNCSRVYMGKFAARGCERVVLYGFAFLVYAVNAVALSAPGGGFFGFVWTDQNMDGSTKFMWILVQVIVQAFYAWWNWHCVSTPVTAPMTPVEVERPYDPQFAMAN